MVKVVFLLKKLCLLGLSEHYNVNTELQVHPIHFYCTLLTCSTVCSLYSKKSALHGVVAVSLEWLNECQG